MKKKAYDYRPVSVIIITRNAATTINFALTSLVEQTYPIKEIIVVDNASTDASLEIVSSFKKKAKIPLTIIKHTKDEGISTSFDDGAKKATSDLLVFLMSDCRLDSPEELEKLTFPLRTNEKIVGSYPTTLQPEYVWETYNFWQKYHAARTVNSSNSMMNGKFDCIRKEAYQKIGGFDVSHFGEGEIGGEDADFSLRLMKVGDVVKSKAKVVHLHYMGQDFSLQDVFKSRKMYARAYGRVLRRYITRFPKEIIGFLFKPAVAILPFLPYFNHIGIVLVSIYAFIFTKKMFLTPSTLLNPRIVLIPLLNVILLYYDVFWIAQAFFVKKKI